MAISEGSPDPAASKALDNAGFGVGPQGKGLTNQVAYHPATTDLADFACKRSYYGGIVTGYLPYPHAKVVTSPRNWDRRRPPAEPR
jgi:hypothetical protein